MLDESRKVFWPWDVKQTVTRPFLEYEVMFKLQLQRSFFKAHTRHAHAAVQLSREKSIYRIYALRSIKICRRFKGASRFK